MNRGSRGRTGPATGRVGVTIPGERRAHGGESDTRSVCTDRAFRRRTLLELGSVGAVAVLAGCAKYLRGDRERRLLETYEDGVESYRTGVDRHNKGAVGYRDNDYEKAVDRLEAALDSFERSVEAFRTAEGIATELSDEEAQRICERAVERSQTLVATTTLLLESAKAFRDGNHDRAQARYEEYSDRFDAAARGDLPKREALVAAIDDGILG